MPSEYEYTHPDYVLFFDEVGDNTNMKNDCALGGQKRVIEQSGVGKQRCLTTDARWTTLGFTARTGEPVMCVIIIKAKDLSPSEILGIDIFATYDEDRSLSENSGATKFFPGGPVCHFRGKDVKCLVFASNGGGINSDILNQCLQHMDSI